MTKLLLNSVFLGFTFAGLAACAHTNSSVASSEMAANKTSEASAFDVKTISCWDVLTVAEEDLNMAMMLLYGYEQGQTGTNTQSSASIETSFKSAFTFCENNPDSPAINGFK